MIFFTNPWGRDEKDLFPTNSLFDANYIGIIVPNCKRYKIKAICPRLIFEYAYYPTMIFLDITGLKEVEHFGREYIDVMRPFGPKDRLPTVSIGVDIDGTTYNVSNGIHLQRLIRKGYDVTCLNELVSPHSLFENTIYVPKETKLPIENFGMVKTFITEQKDKNFYDPNYMYIATKSIRNSIINQFINESMRV